MVAVANAVSKASKILSLGIARSFDSASAMAMISLPIFNLRPLYDPLLGAFLLLVGNSGTTRAVDTFENATSIRPEILSLIFSMPSSDTSSKIP